MENTIIISDLMVILISIISTILFLFVLKNKKFEKTKIKAIFYIYCNFIILLYALYYLQSMFYIPHLIMAISITFVIVNIIILKRLHLYNAQIGIYSILILILIIALGYTSYTPYYIRQHDSRDFNNYRNGGHFGYIGYLFFEGKLPTENPTEYWCFYNPPLFHIISTAFLKLEMFFGGNIESGFENLQIISVLYTMIFNIYVYRILKELKLKKSTKYMLAFVGLSPAMIIMSGSLNNDILSIALSTMAIYYTIRWYKEDKLKTLIKIALTISFAIMTKISSALVAIPIAFVFLIKMIKNKKDFTRYIKHFAIFAIIALPIGLWFPIKNLIKYDIPITYVQSVDESNGANVSRFSVLERLFKIEEKNLETLNVVMGDENIDYNIYLSTLKSFIVDEYINYNDNYLLNLSVNAIFIVCIVLSIMFVINLIYVIVKYKEINNHWLLFFIGLFILSVGSYIKFCFDFPFTFTMNFRYIVPTLISYAVITGTACEKNKRLLYINSMLILIFSVSSVILFTNLL